MGRPTTAAATGGVPERVGLAQVRHILNRLRRVGQGVNWCVASKIGCVALGDWIHGDREEVGSGRVQGYEISTAIIVRLRMGRGEGNPRAARLGRRGLQVRLADPEFGRYIPQEHSQEWLCYETQEKGWPISSSAST